MKRFGMLAILLFSFMLILIVISLYAYTALAVELAPVGAVPVPPDNPQTSQKVELGRRLFFDRRLSGDGTTSCATCHNPEQAFADGLDISLSYPSTKNWRNAPTLINVAFQKYLFHDGRARTLEEQALFPVLSAFEMNKNLDYLEEQIRQVPAYVEEFRMVFGGEPNRERIAMAIAAFERTLVSLNSPLDRYLKGDRQALSADARSGLEVFTGKGKCTECHFGVNLADDGFHALNVPENPSLLNDPQVTATMRFVAKVYHFEGYRTLREDPGRYLITSDRGDWRAFRTPTLRDIAKTAPYMHNGVLPTLVDVIEFFDRGGGQGNTALKPLGLTAEEKRTLKVFLEEALSGDELRVAVPQIP